MRPAGTRVRKPSSMIPVAGAANLALDGHRFSRGSRGSLARRAEHTLSCLPCPRRTIDPSSTERTMNETLLYLSRHNTWATTQLLELCRHLSLEQLDAPGRASYGSIIETFDHLVDSDGGYLLSLGGPEMP